MSIKRARHSFAWALVAIVVTALTIFSGLAPASAGLTFMHIPRQWSIPNDSIRAHGWYLAFGTHGEPTSDIDGGRNVGLIYDGDWTEYLISTGDAPESDTYLVELSVASATNGGTINIAVDGISVGSVEVSDTGGWQNWTTVSTVIKISDSSEALRLTYNGDGDGPLLNINRLDFEYASDSDLREAAVDQMVTALESYAASEGSYVVAGGGNNGSGQAWAFYEGGSYPKSTANVLIDGGHLSSDPLHDELWTEHSSIVGDVLIYGCRDRVGVFTREGDGEPSAEDRDWWDRNGCNRYPIDGLGAKYFAVSSPGSTESETQREAAVGVFVSALESYGAEHGTYRVDGGGWSGNGQGWAFYEGGTYAKSTANVLIEGGHMASVPAHDPLWTSQTSIKGDVLVYACKDRVGVFTREGDGQPSAEDRDWWDNNGCNRYPIDRLGVSYFAVSTPL